MAIAARVKLVFTRNMLRKRLIAKLLIEDGLLVKYKRFTEDRRIVGNPVATAKTLTDQKVDEFMVCDLGVIEPRLVREMVLETMTPVTAAGGIHTMEQVDELIREAGADKVVVKDWELGYEVAKKYGQQAVVFPYDYFDDICDARVPNHAGEVIVTAIGRDGTLRGLDLAALDCPWNNAPVVLCGGCGKLSHVRDAFNAGADGVAISSMWAFTDRSPIKVRSWLHSEGVNVRP